jgi:hypothetical protein
LLPPPLVHCQPPQIIRPTKRNNPGYDAVLTVADGATADISLKS